VHRAGVSPSNYSYQVPPAEPEAVFLLDGPKEVPSLRRVCGANKGRVQHSTIFLGFGAEGRGRRRSSSKPSRPSWTKKGGCITAAEVNGARPLTVFWVAPCRGWCCRPSSSQDRSVAAPRRRRHGHRMCGRSRSCAKLASQRTAHNCLRRGAETVSRRRSTCTRGGACTVVRRPEGLGVVEEHFEIGSNRRDVQCRQCFEVITLCSLVARKCEHKKNEPSLCVRGVSPLRWV
jgi:hypothetical protein